MPTVLIVDDSRAMRRIQRDVLRTLPGTKVLEASDGLEALRRLSEAQFEVDLILADWVMPRMTGLELARRLKSHRALRAIPLVMVTSISDEPKIAAARELGVEGYLLKPFSAEMLLRQVASLAPETEDGMTSGLLITAGDLEEESGSYEAVSEDSDELTPAIRFEPAPGDDESTDAADPPPASKLEETSAAGGEPAREPAPDAATQTCDAPEARESADGAASEGDTAEHAVAALPGDDGPRRDEDPRFQTKTGLSPVPPRVPPEAPFMAHLSHDLRARLLSMASVVDLVAEIPLIKRGERVEFFYVVLQGEVEERRPTPDGGRASLDRFGRGETFAVAELLGGDPSFSIYSTLTRCRLAQLSREAFEDLMLNDPELNQVLSRRLLGRSRRELARAASKKKQPLLDLLTGLNLRQSTCVVDMPALEARVELVAGAIRGAILPGHDPGDGDGAVRELCRRSPDYVLKPASTLVGVQNVKQSTQDLLGSAGVAAELESS